MIRINFTCLPPTYIGRPRHPPPSPPDMSYPSNNKQLVCSAQYSTIPQNVGRTLAPFCSKC